MLAMTFSPRDRQIVISALAMAVPLLRAQAAAVPAIDAAFALRSAALDAERIISQLCESTLCA